MAVSLPLLWHDVVIDDIIIGSINYHMPTAMTLIAPLVSSLAPLLLPLLLLLLFLSLEFGNRNGNANCYHTMVVLLHNDGSNSAIVACTNGIINTIACNNGSIVVVVTLVVVV